VEISPVKSDQQKRGKPPAPGLLSPRPTPLVLRGGRAGQGRCEMRNIIQPLPYCSLSNLLPYKAAVRRGEVQSYQGLPDQ